MFLHFQSEKVDSTNVGMDIALCSFNKNKTELEYAGANRPIWIIRNAHAMEFSLNPEDAFAGLQLEETKATKSAIGGFTIDEQIFKKHTIKLQKGDVVYLFTDGFADQFGQNDKKMMSKRFKESLLSIQGKSMKEQKEHLNTFIEEWKGALEQTDDILVMGIKI